MRLQHATIGAAETAVGPAAILRLLSRFAPRFAFARMAVERSGASGRARSASTLRKGGHSPANKDAGLRSPDILADSLVLT